MVNTPYDQHKGTELWKKVEHAILDLNNNGDITLQTHQDYIIGYIIELIKGLKDD